MRVFEDRGDIRTNIFVSKLVRETDSLRLMLDGLAIDNGHLEVLYNRAVNGVTLCGPLRQPLSLAAGIYRVDLRNLRLCICQHGARREPSNRAAFLWAWCRPEPGSVYPTCNRNVLVACNEVTEDCTSE